MNLFMKYFWPHNTSFPYVLLITDLQHSFKITSNSLIIIAEFSETLISPTGLRDVITPKTIRGTVFKRNNISICISLQYKKSRIVSVLGRKKWPGYRIIELQFRAGAEILVFSTDLRPAMRPTQAPLYGEVGE
jgi:hypothetical protein